MNTKELETLFSKVQRQTLSALILLQLSADCDFDVPDGDVKACLDALALYLQKSEDVLAWIKQNSKEKGDDWRELREREVISHSVENSDVPSTRKGYGEFSEENVLKLLEEKGVLQTSLLQRIFSVGYGSAANMLDTLSEKGYIVLRQNKWVKKK